MSESTASSRGEDRVDKGTGEDVQVTKNPLLPVETGAILDRTQSNMSVDSKTGSQAIEELEELLKDTMNEKTEKFKNVSAKGVTAQLPITREAVEKLEANLM